MTKHLTPAEERRLVRRAQKGDLAARNELIERNMGFIYRQCRRYAAAGDKYDADELLGAATMGYIAAIEKFDLRRGLRLNTLGGWYIYSALGKFHGLNRSTVRVPFNVKAEDSPFAEAELGSMRSTSYPSPIVDSLFHVEAEPEEEPTDPEMLAKLRAAVDRLDERSRNVIRRRYAGETLSSLAGRLGITKERVRQIEGVALHRLKRAFAAA